MHAFGGAARWRERSLAAQDNTIVVPITAASEADPREGQAPGITISQRYWAPTPALPWVGHPGEADQDGTFLTGRAAPLRNHRRALSGVLAVRVRRFPARH